jgi:hypothetical protein
MIEDTTRQDDGLINVSDFTLRQLADEVDEWADFVSVAAARWPAGQADSADTRRFVSSAASPPTTRC